jgi:hypothetical protein
MMSDSKMKAGKPETITQLNDRMISIQQQCKDAGGVPCISE